MTLKGGLLVMGGVSYKEIFIFHVVVLAIAGVGYLVYEQTGNIIVLSISVFTYMVWGVIIGIRISIANKRKADIINNPYKYINPNDASKERIFKHIQKKNFPGIDKETEAKLRGKVFENIENKYGKKEN